MASTRTSTPSLSTRLLIIANDVIGERTASPATRPPEMARVLSRHVRVDLAIPPFVNADRPLQPGFPARIHVCRRMADLRRRVAEADVLMTLGAVPLECPFATQTDKPLILDAYDPFLLAGLELHPDDPASRLATHERYKQALVAGLGAADLVVCASERQRDYWLGMMSALGRVNPRTYEGDPTLSRLVRVVPFGMPEEPPRRTRRVLKGVHPGIGEDDRVVLWGGGLWDWLDATTAVRAMARIAGTRGDVKLVFMGTQRPNRGVTRMAALEEAMALSRQLGLDGQAVIFNTDWVPYAERQNHLLEADVGLCLHRETLEARFSFRTRLLDYVWAGLPAVTSRGDTLGEQMRDEGLARAVPAGAADAVADAILELLETPDLKGRTRPRFEAMATRYRWDVVATPLVEFCRAPRRAPDRRTRTDLPARASRWRALARRVETAFASRGPRDR